MVSEIPDRDETLPPNPPEKNISEAGEGVLGFLEPSNLAQNQNSKMDPQDPGGGIGLNLSPPPSPKEEENIKRHVTKKIEKEEPGFTIDQFRTKKALKENSWSITYSAMDPKDPKNHIFLRAFKTSVLQIPGAVEEIEYALMSVQEWKDKGFVVFEPLIHSTESLYCTAPFQELEYLKDLLPEKNINIQQALKIISSLIEALIQLREHSVLHRNINPNTLLVDKQFKVFLDEVEISFLLERRVQENRWNRDPDFFEINERYISLELLNGQLVDPRSDIYTLGIILFELITGEYAFKASSPEQEKLRQMTNTIGNISKLAPLCPKNIRELVIKCVANDPNERFQKLEEVRDEIDKIRQDWLTPPSGQTRRITLTSDFPIKKQKSTNYLSYTIIGIFSLFLILVALWANRETLEDSDQVWVIDHIARCAGIIKTIEEKDEIVEIMLEDFEGNLRPIRILKKIYEDPNLEFVEYSTLLCEGKVIENEEKELVLMLDPEKIRNPPGNFYYQKAEDEEKEYWDIVSEPDFNLPIQIEGIVLRKKREKNQVFLQLGEGESKIQFFVSTKILKKLSFTPRIGQVLRVEFSSVIEGVLQIQDSKHLVQVFNWFPKEE